MEKKKNEKKDKKAGYQLELCHQFSQKLAKQLNLDLGEVKINRTTPYLAPKLSKNGHQIMWVLPNHSGFFRIYLFIEGSKRKIVKVKDSKQANKVISEIKAVAESIKDEPKKNNNPKKTNKPKTRTVDDVLQQLEKLGNNKGLKVPTGFSPADTEFVEILEKHGYGIDKDNIIRKLVTA